MIHELPPVLNGTPQQQLTAMRDFLLASSLNLALPQAAGLNNSAARRFKIEPVSLGFNFD